MSRNGILIDYDFCCGCHTCEVACQKEHGYAPEVWGIKVNQVGPHVCKDWHDTLIYEYVPFPTDLCDLCGERVVKGKLPTCVQHCQTACMKFGPVSELAKDLEAKPKQMLFIPR